MNKSITGYYIPRIVILNNIVVSNRLPDDSLTLSSDME